jgi:stearoyl-CoA desaturase (delta-9 desaturase)
MSSQASAAQQAAAFPDGTVDYVPLRENGKAKAATHKNNIHISETPMTLSNWYKHVNWLNTTLVVFIPLIGLLASYWVPLHRYTAIWAFVYYFNTGLGITAGKHPPESHALSP